MTIFGFILVILVSGYSGYHYRDRKCVELPCPKGSVCEDNIEKGASTQPTEEPEKTAEPDK